MALAAALAAMLLLLPPFGRAVAAAPPAAAATGPPGSNCTSACGSISIPYPFGVEPGCYMEPGFNLTCDHSHQPPKLFVGDGTVQVLGIDLINGTVRINGTAAGLLSPGVTVADVEKAFRYTGINPPTNASGIWSGALGLGESGPYTLSESRNKLVVNGGCGVQVVLVDGDSNNTVSICATFCNQLDGGRILADSGPGCSGLGCCQADIFLGYSSYRFRALWMEDNMSLLVTACIVESEFNSVWSSVHGYKPQLQMTTLPAVLDWRINSTVCHGNASSAACRSSHSFCENRTRLQGYVQHGHVCHCAPSYKGNPYIPNGCYDINECESPETYPCFGVFSNTEGGYQCDCLPGYEGNASVPNGCKDIDECAHPDRYKCDGICTNVNGTFYCQCKKGFYWDSYTNGGCIAIRRSITGLSIGLGVGGGTSLLIFAFAAPLLIHKVKLQKVKKMKERFFKQNHGLLLQQLISQNSDIGGRTIITLGEIEKATNNFDPSHEIGGGGHGVVYKGLLDLQVVAIKKSKIVVQREIYDFINEVVILSQINHRNIVKLLGCCLEAEVPLLVYEFISNGTLAHHLHVEEQPSLSWDDRLRIALEIAKALAYLHSAASTPILHRDIKSCNVLLDDNLKSKISDFGASKYIPIDQTDGVTTAVQGTIGYLDPEYYYTGRLTDKSDVFSFGVLLIELLTRKKPFLYRSNNGISLVSHFASLLGKGNLIDIVDPQIIEEEGDQVDNVAILAAKCTKMIGEDRPTMREVEMTLENLRVTKKHVYHNTGSRMEYDGRDQTVAHYISSNERIVETSRQYTMEEEILLSARYPR